MQLTREHFTDLVSCHFNKAEFLVQQVLNAQYFGILLSCDLMGNELSIENVDFGEMAFVRDAVIPPESVYLPVLREFHD